MENSKMSVEEIQEYIQNCPINYAMGKIGGKWKPFILCRCPKPRKSDTPGTVGHCAR
jgi:DNA-binding HxlR family transcriptional regulator